MDSLNEDEHRKQDVLMTLAHSTTSLQTALLRMTHAHNSQPPGVYHDLLDLHSSLDELIREYAQTIGQKNE